MANFRGRSTKNVPLTIAAYDKSVSTNEAGEVKAHYIQAGIHPDSEQAKGADQPLLALNSKKDEKSKSGYNNSAPYSPGQLDKIKEAAGDNVAPLLNKDGGEVGKVYGVQADLIPSSGMNMAINTKTLAPTEYSVQPDADGRDIQTRIFETQRDNKAARVEAKAAEQEAAANEPEVQSEAQAEAEQELG